MTPGIEKIAAVDDDGIAQRAAQPLQIQAAEFGPVGKNQQGIGIVGGGIGIVGILQVCVGRHFQPGPLDGGGIIGADRSFPHRAACG